MLFIVRVVVLLVFEVVGESVLHVGGGLQDLKQSLQSRSLLLFSVVAVDELAQQSHYCAIGDHQIIRHLHSNRLLLTLLLLALLSRVFLFLPFCLVCLLFNKLGILFLILR